jgi:hypothetical protein
MTSQKIWDDFSKIFPVSPRKNGMTSQKSWMTSQKSRMTSPSHNQNGIPENGKMWIWEDPKPDGRQRLIIRPAI